MAFTPGQNGGGLTPTRLLWALQSSPTAIGLDEITLNDYIYNYEYIIFYYYYAYNVTEKQYKVILRAQDVEDTIYTADGKKPLITLGIRDANDVMWIRCLYALSADTKKISVRRCYRSGQSTEGTSYCIPYRIDGISKEIIQW